MSLLSCRICAQQYLGSCEMALQFHSRSLSLKGTRLNMMSSNMLNIPLEHLACADCNCASMVTSCSWCLVKQQLWN